MDQSFMVLVQGWIRPGMKIFVNGTFDLLHPGHVALLNHAKLLGGDVTVAIDSDRRVKTLKGELRPWYNQRERATMLLALRDVDQVLIFDTDQDLEIEAIKL